MHNVTSSLFGENGDGIAMEGDYRILGSLHPRRSMKVVIIGCCICFTVKSESSICIKRGLGLVVGTI